MAVVGSLSKVLWGGFRLGFVRAPEPLALRFARVKATSDLGTSAVSQILAERLLSGPTDVWRLRSSELAGRYRVLAAALADRLPAWTFPAPAGGLSLWVGLAGTDAEPFSRTGPAPRRGRGHRRPPLGQRPPPRPDPPLLRRPSRRPPPRVERLARPGTLWS